MLPREVATQLIALHKNCFFDGEYASFFFEHRLPSAKCFYVEENGVVVSAVYARFLDLSLNGKDVKIPFLTGVATHPSYRNRGFASLALEKAKNELADEGYPFTVLHTYIPDFYRKLGFGVANSVSYVYPSKIKEDGVEFKELNDGALNTVCDLYAKLVGRNAHYVKRTLRDTELLIGYSIKEGGSGCVITKYGIPKGYVWIEDDSVEAIAEDDLLFNGCPLLEGKKVVKMGGTEPYSMAHVLDLKKLFSVVPYEKITAEIKFRLEDISYKLNVSDGAFSSLTTSDEDAEAIPYCELISTALGQGSKLKNPLTKVIPSYNIACFEIY